MQYIYIVIRTDIPLNNQAVQACHAAHEAGRKYRYEDGTHLVLCKVKNTFELLKIADLLDQAGIRFIMFNEPDNGMGFTSISTEAIITTEQRKFFNSLPLW